MTELSREFLEELAAEDEQYTDEQEFAMLMAEEARRIDMMEIEHGISSQQEIDEIFML